MSQGGIISIAAEGTTIIGKITGNSGVVTPTSNNVNILGAGSIVTAGSGSTLTVELTGLTNHDLLLGAGTTTISTLAPSSTIGVPLISQGASSDPIYGTALIAGGGTSSTSFTIYGPVVAASTTTGALTSIAPSGTIGIPFISQGSLANPAFGTAVIAGGGTGSTNFNIYGPVVANSTTTSPLISVIPSATSGIPFISQGSSANPTFGTAVVAGGGTGAATFTAYAPIIAGTTTTGAFQSASTGLPTSGYILTSGGSSAVPSFLQNFGGLTWSTTSSTTIALLSNNAYVTTAGSAVAATLPASPALYDTITIIVNGAGVVTIGENSGQQMRFGNVTTTVTTGSLANTAQGDVITLRCTTAGASAFWIMEKAVGNWTVV